MPLGASAPAVFRSVLGQGYGLSESGSRQDCSPLRS
jgi:hypothetical protein